MKRKSNINNINSADINYVRDEIYRIKSHAFMEQLKQTFPELHQFCQLMANENSVSPYWCLFILFAQVAITLRRAKFKTNRQGNVNMKLRSCTLIASE